MATFWEIAALLVDNISIFVLTTSICNISYFSFGFVGWIWALVASVPGLCMRFALIIRVLVVVPCGGPKRLPTHPCNALVLPILKGCLQSFSIIPAP